MKGTFLKIVTPIMENIEHSICLVFKQHLASQCFHYIFLYRNGQASTSSVSILMKSLGKGCISQVPIALLEYGLKAMCQSFQHFTQTRKVTLRLLENWYDDLKTGALHLNITAKHFCPLQYIGSRWLSPTIICFVAKTRVWQLVMSKTSFSQPNEVQENHTAVL